MFLTRQRASQHLHPHTCGSVPALGKNADVTRHYGIHELRHHRGVFIRVPEEQLRENQQMVEWKYNIFSSKIQSAQNCELKRLMMK